MPPVERSKGYSKIDMALRDWSEEDRQDAIEFATYPANGATAVCLYLNQRGIKCSTDAASRWQRGLEEESAAIKRIRAIANDYKSLKPAETIGILAGILTTAVIDLQGKISTGSKISHRDIQSLTQLAKEARSSAIALSTPQSTASMKELELGYSLAFADKLETIFEDDEVMLERVKIACKAILTEIEGQYQNG